MKKIYLVLAAVLISAGSLRANDYLNDERTDHGAMARTAGRYHAAPERATYDRARGDYKEMVPAYVPPQILIGKFFRGGWASVNGRLVYLPAEILAVAPEDASFSAESLNARRVRLADEQ